ncbi:MAG: lamin tail domain-containing protein, partial [SAR202 cluster bacterium]
MKKIFIIFIISYIYAQPDEFQFVATNLGGVIQGTPRINDVRASSSDWVAAFDANGNCAGAGQLVWVAGDVRFNFIVYGDDITSPAVDEGMSSTENFTLKLWDESLNVIIEETNESGNPIYHSGWQSTNFTPIVGYNDPYQEYSFNVNNVDPVILGISLDEKYEDINFDITIDNISFLDEDGVSDEYLTLTLIDSSGNDGNQLSSDQNNYTINGNSVILNENYNGEIVIGMIIDDGFSSSEIYFANIEVLPINDNPFIVSQNIGNQTVFEDSFFVVDVSDFVIEDVDNIAPIATSQIVVNEFLAASDNCCMSPDGNYEDFVELYNGTSESININGWGFSDTEGEVSTIAPDTSIASGDFLVLWFTGDDDGFPEIDSKLSSDGETIYIEDSDGNVVIN